MRYIIFVIVCLSFAIFLYSDDEAASVYIKKAQELAKKKEYKEAIKNFTKAINEAPESVDAYFALGEMYRDIGESAEATAKFNKASDLIREQGNPDKLKTVQNKINTYLAEYEKLRQELNNINEGFLKSITPLLEKFEKEDQEFALIICQKALKITPNHEIFLKKIKELSQKLSDAKKEQMSPLYNGNDFEDWKVPQDWSIENNLIKFECAEPGTTSAASHKNKITGDYNLAAKLKLENAYPPGNILALSFGFQSLNACYAYGFFDQKLALFKCTMDDKIFQKLKEKDIVSDINISDWNELEVEIQGKAIRCYLNGELVFEIEESLKDKLRGNPALIGKNCIGYFKDILYLSDE